MQYISLFIILIRRYILPKEVVPYIKWGGVIYRCADFAGKLDFRNFVLKLFNYGKYRFPLFHAIIPFFCMPVCPGCHASLTSALPPRSHPAGVPVFPGRHTQEIINAAGNHSAVEGGAGFEPTAFACAGQCTSACASHP